MRNATPGLLRAALMSNAAFSLVSGLLLALVPARAADLLGSNGMGVLRALGVGLVVFSLWVGLASRRARVRPLEVLLISMADFAWVLGSFTLLSFMPHVFNATGAWLFAGVAAVVAAFGVAQLTGLRRYLKERVPGLGDFRYCIAVDVDTNPEAMWRVVSDLGAIARYLPTLSSSRVLAGTGEHSEKPADCVGQVRECRSKRGEQWAEEVTRFDSEERAFDVRFLTDSSGFPFPMSVMHGGWQVSPLPEGRSRVRVWWSLTPSVPFARFLVVALMAAAADRDFPAVIGRMAAAAKGEPVPETPVNRLVAGVC